MHKWPTKKNLIFQWAYQMTFQKLCLFGGRDDGYEGFGGFGAFGAFGALGAGVGAAGGSILGKRAVGSVSS